MDLIRRGSSEIIPEDSLVEKLVRSIKTDTPLTVKLGCDPSRPDLHLGHSVVLRKLRHFQDLGHEAILIVGDFTGMIGDPSGKSKTRPPLTIEETRRNGQSYFDQATKILSTKRIKILYNSEWLSEMNFTDVIMLASKYTVARMLERDDFEKRYHEGEPISVHEFLYPLAQAMDSVAIKADVELGGTDQKFNLLVGRDIQREYGQEPQVAIILPLLVGTDGVEKMSKSLDNYIGITDSPKDIYGKTLSIPDNLIYDYFFLTTDVGEEYLKKIKDQITAKPRDLKRQLARELVTIYWSKEAAEKAEEEFDKIFIRKAVPEDLEEYFLQTDSESIDIIQLLSETKLATSRSEARRLIEQGGVNIDGNKVSDINQIVSLTNSIILKVGKRKFLKVTRKNKQ
ncbi:MAG: tyrosine--tRNA ligase [Bacteroidetes bacterium]|nr:tyrosine--tRNA ligase [Bacteroidota bacterium]